MLPVREWYNRRNGRWCIVMKRRQRNCETTTLTPTWQMSGVVDSGDDDPEVWEAGIEEEDSHSTTNG
jgi:hypothetical protein